MHKRSSHIAKKVAVVASVLAIGVAASGCGNDSKPDLVNGKTLFIEKCGGCHTLARANTAGTQGPNLDEAFDRARVDGMGDTIQGVVEETIKWPSQGLYPDSLVMPANLVTGMDARDVAAYVSYAVALEGKDSGDLAEIGGGTDGKGLFKTNCGSCHTLADAGTAGNSGPNLDTSKITVQQALKQIAAGGNGMPAFETTLTKEQIALIAEYIVKVRGK